MKKYLFYFGFSLSVLVLAQNTNLSLDESFGQNGILEMPNYESAEKIFADDDGNIYIKTLSLLNQKEIIKLYPDGIQDLSFGIDGVLNFENGTFFDFVPVDENNFFVIINYPISKFILYNSSGELVSDFASNGAFTYNFGEGFFGNNLLQISDGYLLFAFNINPRRLKVLKINFNGEIDLSFGEDGVVENPINFNGVGLPISKIMYQIDEIDNSIYIVGADQVSDRFFTAKFNQNFELVTEFGENGFANFQRGETHHVRLGGIYVIEDEIVIVGNSNFGNSQTSGRSGFNYRINKNSGQLISSNSIGGGTRLYYLGGESSVLYDNDKIIIGGIRNGGGVSKTRFYIYNNESTYDIDFDFLANYYSMCLQGENKILAAGKRYLGKLFISRHHVNGNMSSEEIEGDNYVTIYPNPAKDSFQIQTKNVVKSVKIYDLSGKLIKTFSVSNKYSTFDLKGNFLIKIDFENGKSQTQKLIIN